MSTRGHSVLADTLLTVGAIAIATPVFDMVVRYLLSSRATLFIEPLTPGRALVLFICLPGLALVAVVVGWMVYVTMHGRPLHLPWREAHT